MIVSKFREAWSFLPLARMLIEPKHSTRVTPVHANVCLLATRSSTCWVWTSLFLFGKSQRPVLPQHGVSALLRVRQHPTRVCVDPTRVCVE
eukprot:2005589-Rhodomonas_salina.1